MRKNTKNSLSVIVPIFNVDKYLAICLNSLCEAIQDISVKEVICVNDGSTDDSLSIIKEFQSKYDFVRLIDKENAGYGAAINSGLDASKGEYVTIVESDDCIIPNIHSKLIKKLEDNPDADFIKTPYLVWVDGQVTSKTKLNDAPEEPFTAEDYPAALMFPPSIWSAVYRRKFLEENNIRVIETPGASYQDTFFSSLLFLQGGKMLYHDEPYYLYRNDRMDASRFSKTKTREIIHIFDQIKEILESKNLFVGRTKQLYYAVYFKRVVWFFSTVTTNFREEVFKLAYNRFTPVFDDHVLYAIVQTLLKKNEVEYLKDLKEGAYRKLAPLFNQSQPTPKQVNDFLFYKTLWSYLLNKPFVVQAKKTATYKAGKFIFLEAKDVINTVSSFFKFLYQITNKIRKKS